MARRPAAAAAVPSDLIYRQQTAARQAPRHTRTLGERSGTCTVHPDSPGNTQTRQASPTHHTDCTVTLATRGRAGLAPRRQRSRPVLKGDRGLRESLRQRTQSPGGLTVSPAGSSAAPRQRLRKHHLLRLRLFTLHLKSTTQRRRHWWNVSLAPPHI